MAETEVIDVVASLRAQLEAGGKCECGEKDVCKIVERRIKAEDMARRMSLLLDGFACLAELGFLKGYEHMGSEARALVKEWEGR